MTDKEPKNITRRDFLKASATAISAAFMPLEEVLKLGPDLTSLSPEILRGVVNNVTEEAHNQVFWASLLFEDSIGLRHWGFCSIEDNLERWSRDYSLRLKDPEKQKEFAEKYRNMPVFRTYQRWLGSKTPEALKRFTREVEKVASVQSQIEQKADEAMRELVRRGIIKSDATRHNIGHLGTNLSKELTEYKQNWENGTLDQLVDKIVDEERHSNYRHGEPGKTRIYLREKMEEHAGPSYPGRPKDEAERSKKEIARHQQDIKTLAGELGFKIERYALKGPRSHHFRFLPRVSHISYKERFSEEPVFAEDKYGRHLREYFKIIEKKALAIDPDAEVQMHLPEHITDGDLPSLSVQTDNPALIETMESTRSVPQTTEGPKDYWSRKGYKGKIIRPKGRTL